MQNAQIEKTLAELYKDSKYDKFKIIKKIGKRYFRPIEPADFKDIYLSITKKQGESLVKLIKENNLKNIIEFGTSFGISTIFLAQGAIQTKGKIITTELIESKAKKAIENFKRAGINELIDVKIGNALDTLKNYNNSIDLLFLDGWNNLYLPLFTLLEPNFHKDTIIYVDNANMDDSRSFLKTVEKKSKFKIQTLHKGKAALIRLK